MIQNLTVRELELIDGGEAGSAIVYGLMGGSVLGVVTGITSLTTAICGFVFGSNALNEWKSNRSRGCAMDNVEGSIIMNYIWGVIGVVGVIASCVPCCTICVLTLVGASE